jgi:hypothetical protein
MHRMRSLPRACAARVLMSGPMDALVGGTEWRVDHSTAGEAAVRVCDQLRNICFYFLHRKVSQIKLVAPSLPHTHTHPRTHTHTHRPRFSSAPRTGAHVRQSYTLRSYRTARVHTSEGHVPSVKHTFAVPRTRHARYTGTGLTSATSAPGLGSPLPHRHRDWAARCTDTTSRTRCTT